jgi:hypothetical protein
MILTQKEVMYSADKKIMAWIHTFNEIQSGPNPLSITELEKLAEKNPRYKMFLSKV